MTSRLGRLRAVLEEPLLVSSLVNVRYLTGLASSNAALLVEPDRTRIFTDFRYAERARALEEVEFVSTRRNLYHDLGGVLEGRIAFEPGSLTYERFALLADSGIELVPRSGLVESLRAVKDKHELEAIRCAAAITTEAYERLAAERFTGRSERELAWWLESTLHALGGEEVAFDVIVAAGPTSTSPHALPGERRVGPGETVIVDAGCKVSGYCSDCTRTFATGELPTELRHAYEVVQRAQLAGLGAVRPGADGVDVDGVARDLIESEGLGEAFGHGLGHGVGLEIHESPWLNPELSGKLNVGSVVTVEPGVYLPGLGGVRIEDLVVVSEHGAEVLTPFTKELVTVG